MHSFAPLCILTPELGALVHTFIRRHCVGLLPARTTVVGFKPVLPVPVDWSPSGPTLDLANIGGSGAIGRFSRAVAYQLRIPLQGYGLTRFLRRHRTEAVLGEYLDFTLPWMDAVRAGGCRVYAHAHGHDVTGKLTDAKWREAYRKYSESDGVVTINQSTRSALINLGIPRDKVHVVHYGVEVPEARVPRIRSADQPLECIAVGRMVPQKAPILLLDAFRRAFEKQPRLHLHYIGSGPLVSAVEEFLRAFDLCKAVTLHSWKANAEVRAMMRRATMFLQHSITDPHTGDAEGLPVAILEAMAEGIPVVSTIHAGIPEAVLDNETGYLVQEGDTAEMADRILRLANDQGTSERFGIAAHQRAIENFTWDRERRELLKIMGLEAPNS